MHDLSFEYQSSQQCEKAYDLQQEIVEIRKRELGDTHPDTLRSMIDLAPIIDEREGGEAFQKFLLDLLVTRELVLGHSHPDTLESVEQLAIWYEHERECDKALLLYKRLEKASSFTYGIDQHETIEASRGIARMLLMQGRLGEAREKQTFTYPRVWRSMGLSTALLWPAPQIWLALRGRKGMFKRLRDLNRPMRSFMWGGLDSIRICLLRRLVWGGFPHWTAQADGLSRWARIRVRI